MNKDRADRHERALAQVKVNRLKEAVTWKETFGTEQGQKCLNLLKKHYYDVDVIANSDTIVTQNRAAQRDLVRYIISQVEYDGK